MPSDISRYGIHSGGAHDDEVVWPSLQASCSSVHDFHAKNAQNARQPRSTSRMRTRLTASGSSDDTASMPTCPRMACTNALQRKVAPTRQNTAASSCQSVDACRK